MSELGTLEQTNSSIQGQNSLIDMGQGQGTCMYVQWAKFINTITTRAYL